MFRDCAASSAPQAATPYSWPRRQVAVNERRLRAHTAVLCVVRLIYASPGACAKAGSGRQSLARLASFILGLSCRQADVSPGCGLVEFREDLKQLYLLTGLERRACVFLFNDTQITDERLSETSAAF